MKIKHFGCWLFLSLAITLALSAIEVTRTDLIPVSVSVTGDVLRPGVYTLTNLNRVSEALSLADTELQPNSSLQQNSQISAALSISRAKMPAFKDTTKVTVFNQRNIALSRLGQKQTLDLLKFFRLGDINQNPYLKDGDVIIVNSVQATITIDGAVKKPGNYEFKTGDTIKDILDLAMGTTENADLKHVMLYRYKNDFSEFDKTEIDLSGYPNSDNNALSQPLSPADRVLIPANSEYRKAYKVQITGKVKMPGIYYVDGKTSLYDLLVMSGGPTMEADLFSSYAYNKLVSESYDPDFERLSNLSMPQMSWLEYSYLRTKTRQLRGKYSVNLVKCWETKGQEANLFLKDGDEVVIPEKINGVWVAGQARQPGLITWEKNLKWKDYLAAAGGYANNRKVQGVRIIRNYSGNWVKPTDKLQLYPGDTIFIPDKEERYLWDDIKDAILLTSQLLTILIAVRTFNN